MIRISVAYPRKKVTNFQLESESDLKDYTSFFKKIGIESRNICDVDETGLDLAVEACSNVLKGVNKDGIDFIVYCTQTPDYLLPTTACVLQERLGLSDNCGAFDYNLGCSGYVYGLMMCKGLIESGIAKKVLLVTAETYSKLLKKEDVFNRCIFGDAATATVFDAELASRIGEFDFGTDGSGADKLIVSAGASKTNFNKVLTDKDYFYMDGPKVYKFSIEKIPNSIFQCLDKNNLDIDEIDYFVFHQANELMLSKLQARLNIPHDKFHMNVRFKGNTVSNTIPIALNESFDAFKIKKGSKVLVCGFGVGFSWATTVLNF